MRASLSLLLGKTKRANLYKGRILTPVKKTKANDRPFLFHSVDSVLVSTVLASAGKYESTGDYDLAITVLKDAIAAKPRIATALTRRLETLKQKKQSAANLKPEAGPNYTLK